MGKIRTYVKNISLKKSLILFAIVYIGIVLMMTIVTVLPLNAWKEHILEQRSIHIYDYAIQNEGINYGVTLVDPQGYEFEALSGRDLYLYWMANIFIIMLPFLYIIIGSILMAKLYYKLKIKMPLLHLYEGVEHIANEDLDFSLTYQSEDELGKLCEAFESMKNELQKSYLQLWQMLAERKALTASIAHDLRTPLTVIMGYLDYLEKVRQQQKLNDDILISTVQNIKAATQRLERYATSIRNIEKIDDVKLNDRSFDLKKYLNELQREFTLIASKHHCIFQLQDLSVSSMICTDQEMFTKILENIFDNALRYCQIMIKMTVYEDHDDFFVIIEDDGQGFSSQDLKNATSFFYSTSASHGGFGIGLSICQILCKKMGGQLLLENNSDRGAKVTVQIKNKHLAEN
ncbi:HAMP domain-containing histidine kinase [[Clostridium] spiroforme]|nr:HAMP domain-containing histidine kinase [Thomasclavelia spiroformis]MBM6879936.1 HAMP domain-containing histidine kinase [Thomasclavelia spiroformis]